MKREVVFAFAVCILVSFAYGIQYTLPDDVDNVVEGVGGSGGGSGSTPALDIDPITSDLILMAMISCYDEYRGFDGEDPRTVLFDMREYYDGNLVGASYQVKYPEPFLSADWDSDVTKVSLPAYDPSNPVHIRFEGRDFGPDSMSGCYAYGNAWHQEYIAGDEEGVPFNTGWQRAPDTIFHKYVDWDKNSAHCGVLGGDWLAGGNYDGFRCCGDDWIWINNNALAYQPLSIVERTTKFTKDELCLYSNYPDYGKGIDVSEYFGTGSYYCDSANIGSSYDISLEYDDDFRGESISLSPFFFIYDGNDETDLGKWSDNSGANPMVCTFDFINSAGQGIVFEWLDIETAANRDQILCELYLGYNWTGSQCCGAPGVIGSYNDPLEECDSQMQADDLEANKGISIADIMFQNEFDDLCNLRLSKNRACLNANSVDNHEIVYSDQTNPGIENVFNFDGTLYFCQSDIVTPPSGFGTENKCELKGDVGDFAVCTFKNDSWKNHNSAAGNNGYKSGLYDDLATESSKVHASTPPPDVTNDLGLSIPTECCFADSCWDGTKCQLNSSYYWWKPAESYWGEKISGEGWAEDIEVYRCQEGVWNGPLEPDYDWDTDTDNPQFCVGDDECACTSTDCPGYVNNGCTNVPNYFVDDHFCDDGDWTSRTKILAAQMMQIAGSNDYVVFCDKYENSVNYYDPLIQVDQEINSVCALKYSASDEVVIGFSINLDYDATDFEIQNEVTGIISTIFGDDLSDCNNAVNAADSSPYGTFRRCKTNSDKYWFNKNTRLLIYKKDGLSTGDPMPANYPTHSSTIDNLFNIISNEITSAGVDINIRSIDVFKNAKNFNRFYIAKDSGDTILGVIEEMYDDYYEENRNFLGVAYTGVNGVDCDTISEADVNAYCGTSGSNIIVLEKNSNDDFPFWNDLTAMLRFAG